MTFLVISSFCLQGNAGGSGAEGKPVSLGFRSEASSDLLTGFFFFMRSVLFKQGKPGPRGQIGKDGQRGAKASR